MKKTLLLILAALLSVSMLSACQAPTDDRKEITVVTTVFAEYDWARQIIGQESGIHLILLTENGTDLHSYQPTVSDIALLSECDILIHTGGVSDNWIQEALKFSSNQNQVIVRLFDHLTDQQKLVEQTQHNHEHHDDHEKHSHEYDEHVWLSLKNAIPFCQAITDALCQKLPQSSNAFRENCARYIKELEELDAQMEAAISAPHIQTVLFADRFPFSYLLHDYGLTCFAAFPGCSSEIEAGFHTVIHLAEQIDMHRLPYVFVLEVSDGRLAEAVIASTAQKNAKILVMDSLQSVSSKDIQSGITYLDRMKHNIEILSLAIRQINEVNYDTNIS